MVIYATFPIEHILQNYQFERLLIDHFDIRMQKLLSGVNLLGLIKKHDGFLSFFDKDRTIRRPLI